MLEARQGIARWFARLDHLDGYTPQTRGQDLNRLLADLLRTWGHRAVADLNSSGNIDVAFAIGHQRYILEAKWERSAIGTGPLAKLQRRVSQRLAGTIGVFVSMSGYSQDALQDLKDGQRLEVLLLGPRTRARAGFGVLYADRAFRCSSRRGALQGKADRLN